jgi:hypothetical protein
MEMDFDEAVGLHSKWKRKLRQALANHDGSLHPADVALDYKCVLGSWIYGEGAPHSALPEYTKLKYEHARFHSVAAALVKRANAGEAVDAEMEPCSTSEFSTASAATVMAMMEMKKRLSG